MLTLPCGNNKGFTLLELMLVLVLGAFLMGVVVTSLSEGPVLRKATREVATSLRQARAQAVIQQKPVLWKMDTNAKHFWLEGADSNRGRELNSSVTAKLNTTTSEVYAKGQGGIRFFPDGSATGGSVELTRDRQTFKVNVEWITGRVSIQ